LPVPDRIAATADHLLGTASPPARPDDSPGRFVATAMAPALTVRLDQIARRLTDINHQLDQLLGVGASPARPVAGLPAADRSQSARPPAARLRPAAAIAADVLLAALCLALVVGSVLFFLSHHPNRSLFGFRVYGVLTASMAPGPDSPPGGFSAGDLILVRRAAPETITAGDIITFQTGPDSEVFLTHRVMEVKTELDGRQGLWFVTRGDANNADDPPVAAELVFGRKVLALPKVGGLIQDARDHPVSATIFFLAAVGFVIALRASFGSRRSPTFGPGRPRRSGSRSPARRAPSRRRPIPSHPSREIKEK
jgi:signal peptidase I